MKLKIVQLIQKPQLRGAEIFACQLSDHLISDGHEVHMISLLPGDAVLPFGGEIIKLNRPQHKRLIDIEGWRQLARHIRAIDPDLVQANAGDTLKFAVLSKLFFRWKAPIVFRNANKVSDFINSKAKLFFNKFLVGRVSHVISVSDLSRNDFIKTYSFDKGKITTVPVGIELDPVDNSVPADLAPVFAGGNVLVNVASFVPEKNHIGLLRIVRHLVEDQEDIRVILIGDGKLKSWIHQQATEMNLQDRIWFTGYRKDVLSIVANAKAFLLPSTIEGLPAVILEAMFCRTPVISYDVGGIPEIVKPDETGWLVKRNSEDSFAAAVKVVLRSTDQERIKQNAHAMVVNDYNNRMIAKRFANVYNRIIQR